MLHAHHIDALRGPAIFIDGFAGGGGTSTGVEQALGRPVDVAINHNPAALAIHKANHPDTEHHCTDIRIPMLPGTVTRGRRVGGIWFSPDCKEFSKAKGGPVKDRSIRTLADEIPHWLEETKPDVAYVENVEEFEDWGPLEQGEDGKWRVILDRKGEDFKKWVRRCRRLGYRVAWRQLRACDYGAPTSRNRLYIVMRCDGLPIVWPKATHGRPGSPGVISGKLLPYRTAAECIDWSIPVPSIFDRAKPHAEATNRRIAHGVVRHVIEAAKRGEAFIVEQDGVLAPHITKFRKGSAGSPIDKEMPTVTANGVPARPAGAIPLGLVNAKLAPFITYGQHGGANRPAPEPHHTIAASKKDTNGVVAATLVQTGYGERPGQSPRVPHLDKPLGTTVAGGCKHAAVTAFMSRFYGSDRTGSGGDPEQPLGTARAGGQHHSVVAAHMAQFNTNPNRTVNEGHEMRDMVSTIATRGPHQGVIETTMIANDDLPPEMMQRATKVAAFLIKYYGEGGQSQATNVPLDVITTRARFAVVTVTIDAVTYVIVDIGLRMLKPRELARAQGFPEGYVLDPIVRKFLRGKWVEKRLTIAEQISAIGNSVCPPVARALVAANQPGLAEMKMAA
jgi:DNA (cytosine-5)-methyltransferase 1